MLRPPGFLNWKQRYLSGGYKPAQKVLTKHPPTGTILQHSIIVRETRLPSLFSFSRCKWPSALALLAMLMLFIAPVISKSLEHQRAGTKHQGMEHHMMMEMPLMEMPATSHLLPGVGASLMDDIACGYCQLLLHVPLIVWLFIPLLWQASRVTRAPPLPVIAPLLPQHDDAEALPRAPPAAPHR
ncbi:DUF2946 domain-containing protein [Dryocola clanedunensis]